MRIYAAVSDMYSKTYSLVPSGQQITWGSWSALDVATGKILWQTADPTVGAIDMGAVSVANGVMYAGSGSGQVYALDTITGNILWSFASGGSVIDAPSIVDGAVYWDPVTGLGRAESAITKCTRLLCMARSEATTPRARKSDGLRFECIAYVAHVPCDSQAR